MNARYVPIEMKQSHDNNLAIDARFSKSYGSSK